MEVEFLYAIEAVGGPGDRLHSPRDVSYDRKSEGGLVRIDPFGEAHEELVLGGDGVGHVFVTSLIRHNVLCSYFRDLV